MGDPKSPPTPRAPRANADSTLSVQAPREVPAAVPDEFATLQRPAESRAQPDEFNTIQRVKPDDDEGSTALRVSESGRSAALARPETSRPAEPGATMNHRPKSANAPLGDALFTLNPGGARVTGEVATVRPPLTPLYPEERYENAAEFARGGLGRVLKARDRRLQRTIAIKEVIEGIDDENEARFLREAQITARLSHPSIVSLYDLGRWETGQVFYTMKLVEGQSLDRVVAEKKTIADRLSLLSTAIDACDAMAYAHAQHVIHRDLKPQNILVGAFGETVVIDWGIAKDIGTNPAPSVSVSDSMRRVSVAPDPDQSGELTQAGSVLGTPSYMAPEQARGEAMDARADVYSLGAILYFILSGKSPYAQTQRRSGSETLRALLEGPPPPLEQREPDVPKDLAAIVKKAMARDPRDRYPSARELVGDLKKFQNGQVVGAYQYTSLELVKRFLRKNRTAVIVAGVLLYILVVGLTYSYVRILQAREGEHVARLQAEDRAVAAAAAESERARKAQALTLQLARASLADAPALSLGYLKELVRYPGFDDWRGARVLASDAVSRGIPRPLGAPWVTPQGHTLPVSASAVSADGRILASGGLDRAIFLWEPGRPDARAHLLGHSDSVTALRFSPDGETLASGGGASDQTVRLWSVSDGKERAALLGHKGAVTALAFSPDGQSLASASTDQSVRLWNASTGKELANFAGHEGPVSALSFSPDGALLASIGEDSAVRLWDVARAEPLAVLESGDGRPYAVEFSPDGSQLAAAGEDKLVRLWEIDGRKVKAKPARVLTGHRWKVRALRFSPDGETLATAGEDRTVRLWPLKDCGRAGCDALVLDHHQGSILALAFSPDGKSLASAGQDQTVRLWETASGRETLSLRGHAAAVRSLSFLAGGRYLLSVGEEAYPLLWSLDQIDRRVLSAHKGFVFATEFSPDGKWLASGGEDDRVLLWDTTSWTVARELQASGDIWDVKFSPDGAWLAAGSADGKISVWDAAQGERLAFISAHERDVYSLGFAPGGKRLASTGPDMMVKLWDLPRGDLVVSLAGHTDEVIDLAFLPGQSRFATASLDGTVRFWDAAQGQPLSSFDARGSSAQRRCSSVAFSSTGRLMAVGDYSAEVQVFRLSDAGAPSGPPKVIKAHSGEVEALSFSPDGQSLASASWDGTVRVHSVSLADWDEPWESRALQSDGRDVDAVAFSPDGKFIAFASEDEKVHVFTDELPREIEAFRAWLQAFPAPPTETRAASQPAAPTSTP